MIFNSIELMIYSAIVFNSNLDEEMIMKKLVAKGFLLVWIVFFLMCVLRLWFTLLGIIFFAVIMTFAQKKRSYCYDVCPVGYIQDEIYKPKDNNIRAKKNKVPVNLSLLRKAVFIVFWGYLTINITLYYDQTDLLWSKMILIMIFSVFSALFMQYFYKKRFWCSHVCPVGSILNKVVQITTTPASTLNISNTAPTKSEFKILEASIQDIQKGLTDGEVTSEKLVKFYLARIDKYDQHGPRLNSIITINNKALKEAKDLDQELINKGPRGPLHGIPIVLKDNFNTYDIVTTGGNKAMAKSQPSKDAFLTKKLRDAGVIIIAKANLHELARAGTTVSSLAGQTLNAYDLTRTPGGSSGGTASAVAANFAVAGVGSDTVNSVRSPASAENLVGLRPTYGLLSRSGIIPAALTQDMAGLITRSVADAVAMLNVLAGVDQTDSITAVALGHISVDYTLFLKRDGLKGKRLGVVKAIVGKDFEVTKIFKKALEDLIAQGAEVVYIEDSKLDTGKILKECDVQVYESNPNLDDYFKTLGPNAPVHNSKELIASGTLEKSIQKLLNDSQALMPNNLNDPNYQKALNNGVALRELIKKTMEHNKLDAFVYPHQQVLVAKISDGGQPGRNGILASIGQTPAITVPGGFSTPNADAALGVPVGIEFMGLQWSEPKLIEIAYAYEQATKYRRLPIVTP